MNSSEVASTIAPLLGSVGAKYMLDPETMAHGAAAGYPNGFAYYVAGRGGVLGDVDSDVVCAAFMFFEKSLIDKLWKEGIAVEGARAAGRRYMQSCDAWGEKNLANIADLEKFISPAEKLVASVDSSGLSLFAGLRAEPLPTQLPARAYRLITLLRELRGCVHISACVIHGINGLEATLLASGGEFSAKLHGWQPPYEDVERLRPNRDAAEKSTNEAMARLIDKHLSPSEMNQLAEQTTRITGSL
ncbi:MAG: evbL [Actinobacteria bacterium]|nr:evbL [Actinomycetota bacterium]